MSDQRPDPTPVALYARVSSDRQDVDLSVAAQLRALRDYADKNGYVVTREYVDEAESGRVADRPQFRQMLDAATADDAPFAEILVWKFSRFTRKREHAVAFKSMLRRRGVRVVSITEHADDSPTGKLMEAIIESVDEFYSANLAEEVTRGMREAASRGFWVSTFAPYGYRKVKVQDGAKERPKLELDPPADAVVRRIFTMALSGHSVLDIVRTLNADGIPTRNGGRWLKNTVHGMLGNEAYKGTLVWGKRSKGKAPPVRVEGAVPAIVSAEEFERVQELLQSRAPKVEHPRRVSSPYLLSGLVRCESCGRNLTAAEAKSGKYAYYVCQSLLKRGKEACVTPRLNARRFEETIIGQLRDHILTESSIRDLVRLLDEEMDGMAREQREKLQSVEAELEEVRRKLGRVWQVVENTDLELADASERIQEHRERQRQLEMAADEARSMLAERRVLLDSAETVAAFAEEMSEFLRTSEITETRAFVRSFVKAILVRPGRATIHYTMPTPPDGPLAGADAAEVALSGRVMSSVRVGGPTPVRTSRRETSTPHAPRELAHVAASRAPAAPSAPPAGPVSPARRPGGGATPRRWEPGESITGRSIWHGRVFTAWPFVVVEDRGDVIAACMPAGALWKRPTDLNGNDIRLPHGPWRLRDDVWRGHGLVRIFIRGAAHSVLVFLGDGDVRRWYVNLEAPFRRTAIGIDTRDHHLDVVVAPDLSEVRWKDEHELDEAVAAGSLTAGEAAAIRAEATRAVECVLRGEHPAIDDRWRTWTPPPGWRAPTLAAGWETPPRRGRG